MTDTEFHPADYHPVRRARRRPAHWRDRYGRVPDAATSPWLYLALGLTAGAAVAYYAYPQDRISRRPDSAPRRARRRDPGRHAIVGRTVTIGKPRAEIYRFWRDVTNLSFMENVERVEKLDDRRQRWTIEAPGGQAVTLETEITEDRQGELIAWRSVEGSDIETHGRIEFRDATGGRGTEVSAVIEYVPPGGTLGRMAAKLFQREPKVQARHDLKRLKMLLETGEIATSQNRKNT